MARSGSGSSKQLSLLALWEAQQLREFNRRQLAADLAVARARKGARDAQALDYQAPMGPDGLLETGQPVERPVAAQDAPGAALRQRHSAVHGA